MISGFQGAARWLSNFAPVNICYDGLCYPSVEHFYVAMKTTDKDVRKVIRDLPTASEAKKFGKTITVRPDWEELKLRVMEYGLRKKFSKQPYKWLLSETKGEIVEENWWNDTFWGVCNGVGENNLGKLIMKIRDGH